MAARSVELTLDNNTGYQMTRVRMSLSGGIWGANGARVPPEVIVVGGAGVWSSDSEGFATGTEGDVVFRVGNTGAELRLYWSNPYVGSNTIFADGGGSLAVSSPADVSGNNARVRFSVELAPHAKAAPHRAALLPYRWRPASVKDLLARQLAVEPMAPQDATRRRQQYADETNSAEWPVATWRHVFAGTQHSSLRNYWLTTSFGYLNPHFTVQPALDIEAKQLDFHYVKDGRQLTIAAFRDAAEDNDIDLDDFDSVIACPFPAPSGAGAAGQDALLDGLARNLSYMQHEVGHTLGLHHPFGFNSEGRCLEYEDPWCIMGMDWSHATTVAAEPKLIGGFAEDFWKLGANVSPATLYAWCDRFRDSTMVRHHRPGANVRVVGVSRAQHGDPVLAVVTNGDAEMFVELRVANGLDQAIGPDQIVIHSRGLQLRSAEDDQGLKGSAESIIYEGTLPTTAGATARFAGLRVDVVDVSADGATVRLTSEGLVGRVHQVSAVARGETYIEMFARATDGALYHSWQADDQERHPWHTAWRDVGPLGSVSRKLMHEHFAISTDGLPYLTGWSDVIGWSGWTPLIANQRRDTLRFGARAPIAAVSHRETQLDLFAVDTSGVVQQTSWHEGQNWQPWVPHSTATFDQPTKLCAIAVREGSLVVLGVTTGGKLVATSWTDGQAWTGFNQVSAVALPPGAPCVAVSRKADLLDVFSVGVGGQLVGSWFDPSTSQWNSFNVGQPIACPGSAVGLVARTPSHLDVYVTGLDGRLYNAWWDEGSNWSDLYPFTDARYDATSGLCAISRRADRADLFAVDTTGTAHQLSWRPDGGWTDNVLDE